jgi:glutaredoxin
MTDSTDDVDWYDGPDVSVYNRVYDYKCPHCVKLREQLAATHADLELLSIEKGQLKEQLAFAKNINAGLQADWEHRLRPPL